jgi:RND family efflux transporter MFP subunit
VPILPRVALRVLASAAIAWPAAACRGGAEPGDGLEQSVLGVTVAETRAQTLRDVATAPGLVVPSAAAEWTIFPATLAEIAELPHEPGATVEAGDLLVRFDIAAQTQALAALQLAVLDAEASLEQAKAELTRQTDLFDRGLLARTAFEESRNRHTSAESALREARSQLQAVEADQSLTVIRARFPGTVAAVWHAKGDMVAGGPTDPVMRVVDPTRIQVAVQLPLAQFARVQPGQTAVVRPIASVEELPATVVQVRPVTDPSAATGEVRLALDSAVVLPLETPVSVELLLDVRTGVLAVPAAAVHRDDLGTYVMTIDTQGFARRKDVRAGLEAGALVQIPEGLALGEPVIVSGVTAESDGLPVEVVQ